MSWIVSRAA